LSKQITATIALMY